MAEKTTAKTAQKSTRSAGRRGRRSSTAAAAGQAEAVTAGAVKGGAAPEEGTAQQTSKPAKRAAKTTAKKSTKKAANTTAKKATKTAAKKSAKKPARSAKKATAAASRRPVPAEFAALSTVTRTLLSSLTADSLDPKTRVYTLAKNIGLDNRELLAVLAAAGFAITSVQKSLSQDEILRFKDTVLGALAGEPESSSPEPTPEPTAAPEQAPQSESEPEPQPESEADSETTDEAADDDTSEQDEDSLPAIAGVLGDEDFGSLTDPDTPSAGFHSAAELTASIFGDTGLSAQKSDTPSAAARMPLFMSASDSRQDVIEDAIYALAQPDAQDEPADDADASTHTSEDSDSESSAGAQSAGARKNRRGRRGRGKSSEQEQAQSQGQSQPQHKSSKSVARPSTIDENADLQPIVTGPDDSPAVSYVAVPTQPVATRGSTRMAAARQRKLDQATDGRAARQARRRETAVQQRIHRDIERRMVIRDSVRHDQDGTEHRATQVAVLEDDRLVEHFLASDSSDTLIGNIYLGRVENVLASMEAAFIDIGADKNGVIYAGDVDWHHARPTTRQRKIEDALRVGDPVLVQVTKDAVGHKGPRLSSRISLPGRYVVYVPEGRTHGISRRLPAAERSRLKSIVQDVLPDNGGAIIRTAAEGASREAIQEDVTRLVAMWEKICQEVDRLRTLPDSPAARRAGQDAAPAAASEGGRPKPGGRRQKFKGPKCVYQEPGMLVRVVRDLFNEEFRDMIVDGEDAWHQVHHYMSTIAPDMVDRMVRYRRSEHKGRDAFETFDISRQLHRALSRIVWLPSGGSLVIDRTEAMTVIDVNTGRFTGKSGNLEETVTLNNLEAAEEIVRQMRLRDLGGMIVVDFIDMVLPENRALVLHHLTEALAADRTRHNVGEVTSLGLVQITRKRLGSGLLETFGRPCQCCGGRGMLIQEDPTRLGGEEPRSIHATADTEFISNDDGGEESNKPGEPEGTKDSQDKNSHEKDSQDKESQDRKSRSSKAGKDKRSSRKSTSRDMRTIEEIADAAIILADEEDPEEPNGSHYLPDEKFRQADPKPEVETQPEAEAGSKDHAEPVLTFEEAKAKFEASPRRRRATRGNSRSDVAPRPEDFEANQPQPQSQSQPQRAKKESASTKKESQPEVVSAPVEVRSARRRSRRSTTSVLAHEQDQAPEQTQEKAQAQAQAQDQDRDQGRQEVQPAVEERQAPAPRRRTRRAVRSSAVQPEYQQPGNQQPENQEPTGQESEVSGARPRRSRRRSTRSSQSSQSSRNSTANS